MTWWSRRSHVPLDVVNSLDLAPGERPLASAQTYTGDHVVATDRAVWLPQRGGPRRIGWECVDRAVWNQEQDLLTVVEAKPFGEPPQRYDFHISVPGRLVEVVHERVNATVVHTRFRPIRGQHGVRVIGRRQHGSDGLMWTVSVDAGIDPTDPVIRALIDETLRAARSDVGE